MTSPPRSRRFSCIALSLGVLAVHALPGCSSKPGGLPTEETLARLDEQDRSTTPPLYQFLYDSAFLPEVQQAEQRTRILIWLRHIDLQEHQIRLLASLHARAQTLRARVEKTQQSIVSRYEPELVPSYNAVYDALREGADLDDPRFGEIARDLIELHRYRSREEELLAVRLQSVRALLDEEQDFLHTLTPKQEALFPDLLFVLRRNLDSAANPEDFRALVGTLFSAGDPTLLLRGDFSATRKPLDIGGLWSDAVEDDLSAPVLHEARRELLLYLLLQESALPEALDAALIARQHRMGTGPAPAPPGSSRGPSPARAPALPGSAPPGEGRP